MAPYRIDLRSMKNFDGAKYGLIIGSMALGLFVGRAQNGAWTRKANAPLPPGSACVLNGKIYVMGGTGNSPDYTDQATNEVYDPLKDTWDTPQPMPTPRGFLSTAAVNDIVHAIGGGYPVARDCVESYNPLTNSWTTKSKMLSPRLGARAVVVDGIIYNIGGNYSERNCESYDPGTDSWTRKRDRPESGGVLSATVHNGIIYTFGGSSYYGDVWAAFSNVYAYDPQTDTWTKKRC